MAVKQNTSLEPGKTIDYLEAEILSIQLTQWGIIGKIKANEIVYNYKLKDPELKKKLILGMDLVIINGFCITNKKDEIVATEGKFGRADTKINLKRYYFKKNNRKIIVTGRIKSLNKTESDLIFTIEELIPPYDCEEIKVVKEDQIRVFDFLKDKIESKEIVRLKGKNTDNGIQVEEISKLSKNHFWNKLLQMEESYKENMSEFAHIIAKQIESIERYYEIFKDLILNMDKEVSKSTLLKLRDVMETKILSGELKFPFNILITKEDIVDYFDKMLQFCKNMIHGNNIFKESNDLIMLIEHYYLDFKRRN